MADAAYHDFGTLLRTFRTTANLTQEDLARPSGLSVHAISMLERGVRRAPRSSTVPPRRAAPATPPVRSSYTTCVPDVVRRADLTYCAARAPHAPGLHRCRG